MSDIEKKEMDQAAKDYAETEKDYKYIAFISYRHLEPDATIAKKIHTMIETFRLPKEFYIDGKKPNFRVFRDREELTTTSLSVSLEDALRNSKYLIVICSKRLPLSEWCNREAETFIAMHGIDRVIPVLVEGEPDESFPRVLLEGDEEVVLEDGEVEVQNKDILAAEFRPAQVLDPNFEGYEYLEKNNPSKLKEISNEALKLMNVEKYRIMAAILGVSYGDLRQRDKVRRQRQLLAISSVIAAALLFFGIFMFNAYRNENIAKRQTIQDKSAFMLDKAEELLNTGDKFKSMIMADKAMVDLDDKMEDYGKLKNRHWQLLNNSVNLINPVFNRVISTNNQFTFLELNSKGDRFVAGLNNDSVGIWETNTGNLLKSAKGHKQQVKVLNFSKDDKMFASGAFDGIVNVWDAETLENKGSKQLSGNIMYLEFTKDAKFLDVLYDNKGIFNLQRFSLEKMDPVGNPLILDRNLKRIVVDPDNKYMWAINSSPLGASSGNSLVKYDIEKGIEVKVYPEDKAMSEDFTAPVGPDGKQPQKEVVVSYTDIVGSPSGKYVYLITNNKLKKLDLATDKFVFEVDNSNYVGKDTLYLIETKDGKYFYSNEGNRLLKFDANTGENVKSINQGDGSIKWMGISKDTDTIGVLTENGGLFTVEDDKLKENISTLKSGNIDYLYLSPNGQNILALSLTEAKIKLIDINAKKDIQKVNGQLVAVSDNQKYAVYISDLKYYLWDTEEGKILREIDNDKLYKSKAYISDDSKLVVSNDGKYLAGISAYILEEKKEAKSELFVIDTENSQLAYSNEDASYRGKFGFSGDGKMVFFTKGINEVVFCSILDKKELNRFNTDSNYFKNATIAKDGKHFYANFTEGIGEVYEIQSGKKLGEVVGQILNLDVNDKGQTIIDALYNNVASRYVNFEKEAEDVKLTDKRSEHGVSLPETLVFNAERNLLLSIKHDKEKHYFYLMDFRTGELIKSFEVELTNYRPMAFISPEAKKIGYDLSMYVTDDGGFKNIDNNSTFVVQNILGYEGLEEIAKKNIEGIQLTDQEKEELNLGEN